MLWFTTIYVEKNVAKHVQNSCFCWDHQKPAIKDHFRLYILDNHFRLYILDNIIYILN